MHRNAKAFAIAELRRRKLRWLKRITSGLLIILIVAVCAWACWPNAAQQRLKEALAELDRSDPGWRLEDIEAAREPIPEGENSARVVMAAFNLLPRQWPPRELEALLGALSPEVRLAPEEFQRLKQELDNVQPALKEARKLADMPRGRHHLEYQPFVMYTALYDQANIYRVVHLLYYDSLQHDQEQDILSALNACRATLHAAASIGDEPFAASQRIRIAGVILTCQGIERALAQGDPPPREIANLQNLLRKEDDFPDRIVIARGERASLHESFTAIERGDVPLTHHFFGRRPAWEEYVYGWFTRDKFREAHPAMLAEMTRFVNIAQLPSPQQTPAERAREARLRALKEFDPLDVLDTPALQKVFDASRRKHVYLRSTIAALAAEGYRQKHKKWPDSLDMLCPQFLASVPRDPFDGELLRYRRVEDGVVMYSVGSDRADNNGNLDPEHPDAPGVDVGVRLWDVDKRRQPPRRIPDHEPQPR
ncbi:MAG TPA: hypothetical protein VMG10_15495 [Gemmataceae bacterium]|nr:hypothetical protein [Gemmataceae bacterium]